MEKAELTTSSSFVEAPFVIVTIGSLVMGDCSKTKYPNFIKGIRVTRMNGTVNMYTVTLEYQVTVGDDPNLIDKALSSISDKRRITLSYGDWAYPSSIYKDETAIVTSVKNEFDFNSSRIRYVITAVSEAQDLNSKCYNFEGTTAKPSDIMKSMVKNKSYGISQVLPGLNVTTMNTLIAGNDKAVSIEPKNNITVFNYMNYLTSCMVAQDGSSSVYKLSVSDEKTAGGAGASLSVKEMSEAMAESSDTFVIDVGYPTNKFITDFHITTDNQWSILFKGSEEPSQIDYNYRIGDNGQLIVVSAPTLTKSKTTMKSEVSKSQWWKEMTEFPITAQVTLKGLTKTTMLMSYVKLNVVFYGQQHITSGLYCIQKDEMQVDASGFRTILTLVRVKES